MKFTDIALWALIVCTLPLVVSILANSSGRASFRAWTLYVAGGGAVVALVVGTVDQISQGRPWILVPAVAAVVTLGAGVLQMRMQRMLEPEDEAAIAALQMRSRLYGRVIAASAVIALAGIVVVLFVVPIIESIVRR